MKHRYKTCMWLLAVLLSTIPITALAAEEKGILQDDNSYYLYYLNRDETDLEHISYTPQEETTEAMLQELMTRLNERERHSDGQSLLSADTRIEAYSVTDQILELEFSEAYGVMEPGRELLCRAGIVRTLLQIPGIRGIRFRVGEEDLKDSAGEPVGIMEWGDFVHLSHGDTSSYRYDTFHLYFADKEGKHLIEESRNVYYRRDLSLERVLLEQLMKGPMVKGHYPVASEKTEVNRVEIYDRVCYVDLGSAFVDYQTGISPQLSVAAVSNSLIATGKVDRVRITVDGDEDALLGEEFSLYGFWEWNEDAIALENTLLGEEETEEHK